MVKRRFWLSMFVLLLCVLTIPAQLSCSKPAPAPAPSPTSAPTPSSTPTQVPKPTTTPAPTQAPSPSPKPAQIKEWVSQAAAEGTYGYTVGQALARVANQSLEQAGIPLRMKHVIGPGSTVNFRSYDKGETDMHYQSAFSVMQAWTNTGVFEKDPLKHKSYQGVYTHSGDNFAVIRPDSKGEIKSYSSFAGKKVWPYALGSASYEASKMVFEALGIWDKIQVKQVGYNEVGSSLKSGVFDVAIITTISGGRSVPPWTKEMILTSDLSVVEPTQKEKEIMGSVKALVPLTYPAERVFGKKSVGVSEVWNVSYFQGWNFPAYGTTDEVYAMVKAWYEHADQLVAFDAGMRQFAEDGLKYNVQVLDSLTGIPVHSGVAKYYKERGVWKDKWVIGDYQPKNW